MTSLLGSNQGFIGQQRKGRPVIEHEVRSHKSADALRRQRTAGLEARRGGHRRRAGRGRGHRDGRQPADRRRRRGGGRAEPAPGGHRPRPGPLPPASRSPRRCRLRLRPRQARVSPEWAAWANGVAVRELDFHDTFLAAEYSHPGDNIPPLLAVAQHAGRERSRPGQGHRDGLRGPGRPLPGDLPARPQDRPRGPPRPVGRRRARDASRLCRRRSSTRRSARRCTRRLRPASPARARSRRGRPTRRRSPSKVAIEAVDRAMRGETSPAPIYEGEDGVIAWLLDGPDATYRRPAPGAGRAEAGHPADLHQGILGRVPGSGLHRPRQTHARPRSGDLSQVRSITDLHQPPHPLRHRHGLGRPAEVRPSGDARDAGPLAPVHLRRRARGRRVGPREVVRAASEDTARDGRAVAQDHDGGGPDLDGPLPVRERHSGGRPIHLSDVGDGGSGGRDADGRRHCGRGRDRRGGRPPPRRQAVRPTGVRGEVPPPGIRDDPRSRTGALPGTGPAPPRAGAQRRSAS